MILYGEQEKRHLRSQFQERERKHLTKEAKYSQAKAERVVSSCGIMEDFQAIDRLHRDRPQAIIQVFCANIPANWPTE